MTETRGIRNARRATSLSQNGPDSIERPRDSLLPASNENAPAENAGAVVFLFRTCWQERD